MPLDYWMLAFYVLGWAVVAVLARKPRIECRALQSRLEELEAALARAEVDKIYYASKIAGLAPEAARLLDAVLRGEVRVSCRDGRPASVVGGEVVCLGGGGDVQ